MRRIRSCAPKLLRKGHELRDGGVCNDRGREREQAKAEDGHGQMKVCVSDQVRKSERYGCCMKHAGSVVCYPSITII